ncbi:MAG: tRNA (adenosine(37)-N6)-threonylcarbamoyltransferase complex ATPase subunit type 1 TsaE [Bacteroidetes bacterium]|nr:MAG: tRNA (adenosine(37)-N6)-threonylcarbamoyltransferase complex ATPase subunit type 1 TsaE [Bacteroidota bacterium]
MEWIVSLKNIRDVADRFWKEFSGDKIFAFEGEMGTGKTTFIHALCEAKKVTSPIGSPTFSIINEYIYPGGRLYHIDLYRLEDEDEAIRAGVEDCLYSGEICLVEWPHRALGIFPPETIFISMSILDPDTRKIVPVGVPKT